MDCICPSCDSPLFGAMWDQNVNAVVRGCTTCGYKEEASPAEVALWEMEHEPPLDQEREQ